MDKAKKVKVIHDHTGNTLTVWFGDLADEYICSEAGEEVVLMRDTNRTVIGFELHGFLPPGDLSGFSGEVEVLAKPATRPYNPKSNSYSKTLRFTISTAISV